MLLCPTALYRPEHATPICLKAHHLPGLCTSCQSLRVPITQATHPPGLLLLRDRVERAAGSVADALYADPLLASELYDIADELGALHRSQA